MQSGYPSVKIVRFPVRLFVLPALGRKVGRRYFFSSATTAPVQILSVPSHSTKFS